MDFVRTKHFAAVDHGSLIAFTVLTPEARAWVEEHVQIPAHMKIGGFGARSFLTFMCEVRYANDIITALLELDDIN